MSAAAVDRRVLAAVRNNALWCDLVCRSHDLPTETSDELWIAPQGSPPFYPDAVTLAPRVPADAVLRGIDDRPGCSVKDSFADLELGDRGFTVLFEARWLFHPPAPLDLRPRLNWRAVTTEDELEQWANAAALDGIIRSSLVQDDTLRFLVARQERAIGAVAAVNRSGDALGVSNVFTAGIDAEAVWSDLAAAVGQLVGALPLVGYEHGDELVLAQASGFVATGPLRVWVKPST